MREINVNKNLSLKVFNKDEELSDLTQNAIFVVPHNLKWSVSDVGLTGDSLVTVLYAGVFGLALVSKKGRYGGGYGIGSSSIKHSIVCYSDEPERQAEGYLSLLRLTEGQSLSVVLVDNKNGASLDDATTTAFRAYKDVFVSENEKELKKLESKAVKNAKKCYSFFSHDGWRRRLNDSTMTSFFMGEREFIDMMTSVTHPNGKYVTK